MTTTPHAGGGFFSQPKAVWAVAFAAVVSFMGLGLVDPILPAIAKDLDASPSQVELLFTSYFAVTGVSMLVTSAVASRIGPKRTLLVKRLEERGWVARRRDPSDGRVVLVSLTDAGAAALEDVRGAYRTVLRDHLEAMPEADIAALTTATTALERLIDSLQQGDL